MGSVLNIGKKYLRFFVENHDERWVMLQGGRRSGKSFAVYHWLHFLASANVQTVGIVAATFPALQLAISDFQRATGLVVQGNAVLGYSSRLSNGSTFLFRSFDVPEKCQGSTFDTLYLEEALNIPQQVISVLSMSVTGQIFCAFNPTKTSHLEDYVKKDGSNLLCTTFKDNPFLTKDQIGEFEKIKERAMRPTASLLDIYNYTVYYKGEFGKMNGKVFKMIYTLTNDEYDAIPAPEMFGLDFGFTQSEQSDATALVGCKIFENCVYYKQYIYSTQMANNKDLALRMVELGLDCYTPIVADYGGMGATRIRCLVTADNGSWVEEGIRNGFTIQNAQKGKIIDGLNKMNQYDKIYVTEESYEMRKEFDNYELNAEGKPKGGVSDHSIDACRYATTAYTTNYY